jgi:hypothetical protein
MTIAAWVGGHVFFGGGHQRQTRANAAPHTNQHQKERENEFLHNDLLKR